MDVTDVCLYLIAFSDSSLWEPNLDILTCLLPLASVFSCAGGKEEYTEGNITQPYKTLDDCCFLLQQSFVMLELLNRTGNNQVPCLRNILHQHLEQFLNNNHFIFFKTSDILIIVYNLLILQFPALLFENINVIKYFSIPKSFFYPENKSIDVTYFSHIITISPHSQSRTVLSKATDLLTQHVEGF